MAYFLDQDRHREPEVMDQPDLPEPEHVEALRGLARLNALSRSAQILWLPIRRQARRRRASRPLRLLDIACGGGDVPLRLWKLAQRQNLPLEIAGCDVSRTALKYAREQAEEAGAEINYFRCDVLSDEFTGRYDIVSCSLFLHHLGDRAAVSVLGRMAAVGRTVLVSDLDRSRLGYLLALLGSRVATRSPVVHIDALRSVRAAYTPREVRHLAEHAGLRGVSVHRKFPCRMLLCWRRR
ncbi:MAG: methyltransferase domain-containing protein [Phycisphaeraceae bacterium]